MEIEIEEIMVAGNLIDELEEINKIVMGNDVVEIPGTSTATCGSFLTLFCC